MGKAAARCGDTANTCNDPADAPVGTVIAVGTVLIDKMPAAKQNDQIVGVDTHIVMIPTPGGPVPTPLPHPFAGMIDSGCSTSVNIMGMPAATVDSMASAVPPHIPQGGPFQKPPANKAKIIMGSPTVFIGGGSGGGGGGGGGGSTASSSAQEQTVEAGHTFDVWFVDKGGKPIMGVEYEVEAPDGQKSSGPLTGQVKKSGVAEGDHTVSLHAITRIGWSPAKAQVGDTVKLQVETAGIDSGEIATLVIYMKDANFADIPVKTIETEVNGDKIEAEWVFEVDEDLLAVQDKRADQGYSSPFFYFYVNVVGLQQRSGLLKYKDWVELRIKNDLDKPAADAAYTLHLPDGSTRTGTLDKDGYAKEENLPAGRVWVSVEAAEEEAGGASEDAADEVQEEEQCQVPPLKALLEETAKDLDVDPYDFELFTLVPAAVLGFIAKEDFEKICGMGLPEADINKLKKCVQGEAAAEDNAAEPMTVREYYAFAKEHDLISGSCGETSNLLLKAVLKSGATPRIVGDESIPAEDRWVTPAAFVETLRATNRPQWYARVGRSPHSYFIECINEETRVYQSYFGKYLLGKCLLGMDDKVRDRQDLCDLLEQGIPNQDVGGAGLAHKKLFGCAVEWKGQRVTVELVEEPADEAGIRKNLKDLFNKNAPQWKQYFAENGDKPMVIKSSAEEPVGERVVAGQTVELKKGNANCLSETYEKVELTDLVVGSEYSCGFKPPGANFTQSIVVRVTGKRADGVVTATVIEAD